VFCGLYRPACSCDPLWKTSSGAAPPAHARLHPIQKLTSCGRQSNKLPLSLVQNEGKNGIKHHHAKGQIEQAPFGDTFGPKAQRKRPKLDFGCLEDLAGESVKMHDTYLERLEQAQMLSGNSGIEEQAGEAAPEAAVLSTAKEPIFSKGQSKRIWNEVRVHICPC